MFRQYRRNTIAASVALLLVATLQLHCDHGRAIDVTTCAVKDDKLSVALTDPRRAVAYMTDLSKRLEAKEAQAVADAVDLLQRAIKCVEK